ncbi:hypothetical protein FAX13_08500 [Ligilactobacillus animalis]|nr:hypothetical protein FAX13_08500 [Ligilactobacillus animalis]
MENNHYKELESIVDKEVEFLKVNSLKLQLARKIAPKKYNVLLKKIVYTEGVIRQSLQLGNLKKAYMYVLVLKKLMKQLADSMPDINRRIAQKFEKIK